VHGVYWLQRWIVAKMVFAASKVVADSSPGRSNNHHIKRRIMEQEQASTNCITTLLDWN